MNRRFFQYLAGERKGEVLEFDKIKEEDDMVFICFKDGSRCNEELILPLNNRNWSKELMAEISDPQNVWRFKEEWVGREEEKWSENANGEKVCVQPFVPGRKKVIPIPPKPVKSKFGTIDQSSEKSQLSGSSYKTKSEEKPDMSHDPIWVMMEKAKKFPIEIPMTLNISLPTKSLYDVAKESFDEGGEKIIEYIISNIDDKMLKNSLKEALLNAYEDEDDKEENTEITKENNTGSELFEPETVENAVIGENKVASDEDFKKWKKGFAQDKNNKNERG